MTKQVKADLMLVLVTFFWGISYLLMDISLKEIGTFSLNTLRFLGAFAIAGLCFYKKIKEVNRLTLKYSFLVGTSLFFVYMGATFGVQYTSLSNAGFLCALTVVFTPILAFFFLKQRPTKKFFFVLLMAVSGIALLTLNGRMQPALGDILCVLCAVAYAVDLLLTEEAVKKEEVNAFQLGVYQLLVTGVWMALFSFCFEGGIQLPKTAPVWGSVIVLSVFCTGLSFIVQAVAQQYTSASHVGVIFCLEPVFNGFVAFFIVGEVLSTKAYIGAILLVLSLLFMEIDLEKIIGKFKT